MFGRARGKWQFGRIQSSRTGSTRIHAQCESDTDPLTRIASLTGFTNKPDIELAFSCGARRGDRMPNAS